MEAFSGYPNWVLKGCRVRQLRNNKPRSGFVLVEVIVAVLIFSAAALAIVSILVDTDQAMHEMQRRESQFLRSANFLQHVVHWNRRELELRLGNHAQGEWRLNVEDLDGALFRITLSDSIRPEVAVLQTYVFRAPESAATPHDSSGSN